MNTEQLERIIKRNSTHGTFGKMVSMSETDFRALFAGKVLVPVEPTEAMASKGAHVNSEWLNDNAPIGECRYRRPAVAVYKAMITASQEPKQ